MQIERTRLYRVKAVAEVLDVSQATVYRAIESGRLAAVRLGAAQRAMRVSGEAIMDYLAACAVVPVQSGPVDSVESVTLTGLTETQADGLACVVCDLSFLAPGAGAAVPVGRSETGSQVFACASHDGSRRDLAALAQLRQAAIVAGEVA